MPTHLRPTQMAQHLDIAAQRISQLVHKGIIDPPGADGFDVDATRIKYIRHLRAHLAPHAGAMLTEERAKLIRARRERMELETARMARLSIPLEEVDRQFAMVKSRLVGIEAAYANSIAEAARRADSIFEANAAVGARLRSVINEALGELAAAAADIRKVAA
jgi:hypothetical protein